MYYGRNLVIANLKFSDVTRFSINLMFSLVFSFSDPRSTLFHIFLVKISVKRGYIELEKNLILISRFSEEIYRKKETPIYGKRPKTIKFDVIVRISFLRMAYRKFGDDMKLRFFFIAAL